MKFSYTYRSSDGQRHASEIEADSRDAAFAAIRREFGIRPIRVVATGGEGLQRDESGGRDKKGSGWKIVAWVALVALVFLAAAAFYILHSALSIRQVMTPQGPVTYTTADPLPRQRIPGDRQRIDAAKGGIGRAKPYGVFKYRAEAFLAGYSEPGRQTGHPAADVPSAKEFDEALNEQLRVSGADFTEVVDLKRIVEGMKREMRAYLAAGGTVEGYLAELEKRQRLEISYRENAEQRLNELLKRERGMDKSETRNAKTVKPKSRNLEVAYEYWLKANAQLQAMGIYPLALPDALRNSPMEMDFTE